MALFVSGSLFLCGLLSEGQRVLTIILLLSSQQASKVIMPLDSVERVIGLIESKKKKCQVYTENWGGGGGRVEGSVELCMQTVTWS